jgi:hypothetical protein
MLFQPRLSDGSGGERGDGRLAGNHLDHLKSGFGRFAVGHFHALRILRKRRGQHAKCDAAMADSESTRPELTKRPPGTHKRTKPEPHSVLVQENQLLGGWRSVAPGMTGVSANT